MDYCDHCDRRRVIVFAGLLPFEVGIGWGKFCAECLPVVLASQENAPRGPQSPAQHAAVARYNQRVR